jgi:hypothetical protein
MRRWHQDVLVDVRQRRHNGCHRARCVRCHFEKVMHIPSRKECIARVKFREQLREIGR